MSWNLQGTNAIVRKNFNDIQEIKKQNKIIIEMLQDSKEENRKINTYVQGEIPDIKQFFPLKNDEDIDKFFDNSDGLLNQRRKEFCNMIMPCAHEKKNLFGTALLKKFFSMEFINTHQWPTKTG